ncbi:hypothetical protein [Chamaesiphon sp. VAR_48_metabat_403]|uniref:hypothetical protein n=1 Tax=Chamaesiphon sp. VAR_48_metabat_403 TaxID=2964700 RepID=UPI00286D6C77|nr:hypothetical protein [Chamaesiphon sp. VAR_48_metabat_403]
MKQLILTLTLIILSPIFALPTIANPTSSERAAADKYEYQYADGAGNSYIIDRQSIDYRPITRAESSSGMYDGGTPRKVKIDARQYQEIADKLDRVLDIKSIDTNNGNLGRAKGTGLILKPDKNRQIQRRVIASNSQERREIEALLDRLIGGKNSSILNTGKIIYYD